MRFTSTSSLGLAAAFASVANAHTVFTTLFINDVNQGAGTCVRMPRDGATATAPIAGLMSDDMACGRDGTTAVPFVCPAPASSKLSFLFRIRADGKQDGAIDISHKGPCSVYVKQVADMFNTPATGGGWFKIFEEGYDDTAGKWCTEKLIDNEGLLSVQLPSGLPAGYYLIRPEALALHQTQVGDPQYYPGCAQVFVESGPSGTLEIPADKEVSIPGYVDGTEPGNTFNLWRSSFPYEIPGPRPFNPTGSASGNVLTQTDGVIPEDCLIKNANWCGKEVPSYSDQDGCWAASADCFDQADDCYKSAPPTGSANCAVWIDKCKGIQDACHARNFNGPPNAGQPLQPVPEKPVGDIPPAAQAQGQSEAVYGDAPAPAAKQQDEEESSPAPASEYDAPAPETEYTEEEAPVQSTEEIASNVSVDGSCGGSSGKTCRGSVFGSCCSAAGYCGSTKAYCRSGCQPEFGRCRQAKSHSAVVNSCEPKH